MTTEAKGMKSIQRDMVLPIIVFLCAFCFLYWKTIQGMVMDWYMDENYSHGFLIPLISGYILWQRREELTSYEMKPYNTGLLLVLSGLAVYLVGNVSGESFTRRISMLIVIAGVILFSCGTRAFKEMSFPFFFLIFMIPLPYILYDAVAFPLKLFVS